MCRISMMTSRVMSTTKFAIISKVSPIGLCMLCHRGIAGTKCLQLPCVHIFHDQCFTKWLRTCDNCPVCTTTVNTSVKTRKVRVSRARKAPTKKPFVPQLASIPENPMAVKPVRLLERKVMNAFAVQFPAEKAATHTTKELLKMVVTELNAGMLQTNPTKAFIHGLFACWVLRHVIEKTHPKWAKLAATTTDFIDRCRMKLNFTLQ